MAHGSVYTSNNTDPNHTNDGSPALGHYVTFEISMQSFVWFLRLDSLRVVASVNLYYSAADSTFDLRRVSLEACK